MRSLSLQRPAGRTPGERVRRVAGCACLHLCVTSLITPAAEITMFDDVIVVYKFVADLMFFVTGGQDDNELILQTVLQAFYESVSLLLRCAQLHSTPEAIVPVCVEP